MKTYDYIIDKLDLGQLCDELKAQGITASITSDRATKSIKVMVEEGVQESVIAAVILAHNPIIRDKKAEYSAAANKADFLARELGFK